MRMYRLNEGQIAITCRFSVYALVPFTVVVILFFCNMLSRTIRKGYRSGELEQVLQDAKFSAYSLWQMKSIIMLPIPLHLGIVEREKS